MIELGHGRGAADREALEGVGALGAVGPGVAHGQGLGEARRPDRVADAAGGVAVGVRERERRRAQFGGDDVPAARRLVAEAAVVQLVQLRVRMAVAADLHAPGGQFAHLVPVQHRVGGAALVVPAAQPPRRHEQGGREAVPGQGRQGVPVHALVAVVERDQHRPRRQPPRAAPPDGGQRGRRQRGEPPFAEQRQLLGERVGRHRQGAHRRGRPVRERVVHQDRYARAHTRTGASAGVIGPDANVTGPRRTRALPTR